MSNFAFVRSVGSPRIGEVVTLDVFLPFFLYFLTFFNFLLTCPDRIIRRRNVVNGS